MRFAKVCLVVLCAAPARADSFADLKAAVAGLRGAAPIRATIEMQRVEVDKGKKPPETVAGGAVVDAMVDGDGLHVAYAPALLAKVADEQAKRQANPDLETPTAQAVAELGPLAIAERLDFGRRLAGLLSRSELVSEKRVVYDGRPARLLALKIKNRRRRRRSVTWRSWRTASTSGSATTTCHSPRSARSGTPAASSF